MFSDPKVFWKLSFLHALTVLCYLSKLKRVLGLGFAAHFLYNFPCKYSLFNTLSIVQVSIPDLVSLPRYQTINWQILVSPNDDVIKFEITWILKSLKVLFSWQEKNRARWKYKNLNILRIKKASYMK